jgi:hypothetical protein
VGFTLVHQYLSQFSKKKIDAVSTVGSSIIFSVDSRDAHYLVKDLQGKVTPAELVALKKFEAIARIDTEVVKFATGRPLTIPRIHYRDQVIEKSRRRYCRPASAIRDWIRKRDDRWCKPSSLLSSWNGLDSCGTTGEFKYDEFD